MSVPEKGRKRPQSQPDTLRTWLAAQSQEYLVSRGCTVKAGAAMTRSIGPSRG